MHLIPCPNCDATIPVSPAQAGDQTVCPNCSSSVDIPKLGQLRLLPQAEQPSGDLGNPTIGETSVARNVGFGLFAFVAAGSLLVGGYCGIRWVLTEVPLTTEQHIAELRTEYKRLEPALLIREYEEMEKYGLDLPEPYNYKITENSKRAWGRNSLIAAGIGTAFFLAALLVGMTGRKKRSK